jgi:hypothetical protein
LLLLLSLLLEEKNFVVVVIVVYYKLSLTIDLMSRSQRNKHWDRNGPLADLLQSISVAGSIPKSLGTAKVIERYPQFSGVLERNFRRILSRYRAKYCQAAIEQNIAEAERRRNNRLLTETTTTDVAVDTVPDNNSINNNNNIDIIRTIESNNILLSLSKYG